MNEIHMGQLLEGAIRRKGLNITQIADALNVSRRTLYNWFKQEVIDEHVMERISGVIVYDAASIKPKPTIIKPITPESLLDKDEAYWQDKYIDLLERYAKLLANQQQVDFIK